jgi:hypothetical protein
VEAPVPGFHRLKHFVDRAQILQEFGALLAAPAKLILCIQGPGGIGKSLLISRMISLCEGQQVRWVYVEWEDYRRFNYLDIMRRVRDGSEPDLFQLFTDRVNFYTVPNYNLNIAVEGSAIHNVEVLSHGEIQQSGVTVHVGHEIKDLNINMPRPDKDIKEDEIIRECTRTFLICLKSLCSTHHVVIFLDALEKADNGTSAWLWNELLKAVIDNQMRNLTFVLAGRERLNPDSSFFDFETTLEYDLKPFQKDDILDYLEKRGVERNLMLADFIFANQGEGHPQSVAISVNNFLKMRRAE